MSEIMLILRREFLERVRTRGFLLGTILFPVFMAAILIVPAMFDESGEERRLAVIDEAPAGVGERFVQALTAPAEGTSRYTVEVVAGPLDAVRDELHARIQADELHGYVVLPADVLERNQVQYRAKALGGPGVLREIRAAASQAVQAERLQQAGLEIQEVAALIRPVEVDNARITAEGEEGADAESTFLAAYIIALAIYMLVAMYGMSVMRSVLEEKTNRIAEVLASSVRASHLMAGKILGVGSAALVQVLIWVVLMVLLVTQSDVIAARFGMDPDAIRSIGIAPGTAVLLVAYFLLGFFLFASLFAVLGAAVTSEQEAQSLQMVLMVPLFVPLLFLMQLASDPLGRTATILGLVPFTAPIAMPMRMAAAPIPAIQIVGSLALLALALIVCAWLAGKIYRIGILSTGKRATLRDLAVWIRTA
jgi:ABC-2 type transport system permease protein